MTKKVKNWLFGLVAIFKEKYSNLWATFLDVVSVHGGCCVTAKVKKGFWTLAV